MTKRETEGQGLSTPEPSTEPITPVDGSNPLYYNNMANQILLSLAEVFGYVAPRRASRIFEEMQKKGYFSVQTLSALYVIKNERIITAHDLEEQLDMPETTRYRVLKCLLKNGVIEKISKIRCKNSLPGPRLTLYGLPGDHPDALEACMIREAKRSNEGYSLFNNLKQVLIDDYLEPYGKKRLHYWTMCQYLKAEFDNKGGYSWQDIFHNVAAGLKNEGYEVFL